LVFAKLKTRDHLILQLSGNDLQRDQLDSDFSHAKIYRVKSSFSGGLYLGGTLFSEETIWISCQDFGAGNQELLKTPIGERQSFRGTGASPNDIILIYIYIDR
jgi:hypothetical protein